MNQIVHDINKKSNENQNTKTKVGKQCNNLNINIVLFEKKNIKIDQ